MEDEVTGAIVDSCQISFFRSFMFVKNHLKVRNTKKGETGTQIGNKTTYADKNNFYLLRYHRNFTSKLARPV